VLPPPEALADLAATLRPLRRLPGGEDLRWTEPDGWHYTLAYLGAVPDARRSGLDERLARAARRHEPLSLRTSGGGRFGDRVLWAGAEGDLRALSALADSVRAAARRAGTPADEEHAFRAHLTLARARKHAAVDRARTPPRWPATAARSGPRTPSAWSRATRRPPASPARSRTTPPSPPGRWAGRPPTRPGTARRKAPVNLEGWTPRPAPA
jgi:2'-5' RNA ligase